MSRSFSTDWLIEVARGNVPGASLVHKFGMNYAVGGTYVPLCVGGLYNTPQTGSATTLRIKAGNANDTAAGSGAREITLQGLDETGALVSEAVATAGASASSATTATFMRLFRAYVSASGTYATQTTGSHSADIDIENGAGGTDWATIYSTGFPHSQSEICVYSVPLGKKAYVLDYGITSDANKDFDFIFFKRESILATSAPYEAMRIQFEGVGIEGEIKRVFRDPLEFPALTDFGFMVTVGTGTAQMSGDMNILLIDD